LEFEDENISFASTVTLASLRVTLQSFLEIIPYWTGLGFAYVLTGKISQDSLEVRKATSEFKIMIGNLCHSDY